MSKKQFLPKADLERQKWQKNFSSKLGNYATKYGIAPEEVDDMVVGSTHIDYWMDYLNKDIEYLSKLTAYKNESMNGVAAGAIQSVPPTPPNYLVAPPAVAPGIFKRASSLAKRIKAHKDYTIADGNDLGLEGAVIVLKPEEQKPVIKLRLIAGGKPEVVWTKQGMDGIEIYVDRATGAFALLAFDTYPNYIDNGTLPATGKSEVWRYKAIYRYGDEQAGMWSDEVSITVTGS